MLATVAQAQIDTENVGGTGENIDTDFTPVAKEYGGWQRVAGADFGADHVTEGSGTTFGTDLYTVTFPFGNDELGFAGGSVCAREPERGEDELESFRDRVRDCKPRLPVIYRYSTFEVEDPTVEGGVREVEEWRAEDLPGSDKPGYVGAIAFIDSDRALAVGGTGEYVRRERSAEGMASYEDWVEADPAENGRAWLWQREHGWRELKVPSGMRGLNAVAFAPPTEPELGFAGGLGQLWKWGPGGFTGEVVDRTTSSGGVLAPSLLRFRFRVRSIQFAKSGQGLRVHAITAGCCSPGADKNAPLILMGGSTGWNAATFGAASVSFWEDLADTSLRATPVSYYDMALGSSGDAVSEVLAAPDGPASPLEFDSRLLHSAEQGTSRIGNTLGETRLSTARLVAFDGAVGSPGNAQPTPRWTVGLLRSTGQALAESTHLLKPGTTSNSQTDLANWGIDTSSATEGTVEVDPEQPRRFVASYNYFKLPSYALNAIEMVEPSAIGWAVGDHGAILKVGDPDAGLQQAASVSQQRLPTRERRELPSEGAYAGFQQPPVGPPGTVPGLLGRSGTGEPGFHSGGWVAADGTQSDRPVSRIVMSRDGSEGWALEEDGMPGLYHFDGESWYLCDPLGIQGQLEADELCAGARIVKDGQVMPLEAIARVPLEYDSDPTNDDEFEAVAISTSFGGRQVVLRYRQGSWQREGQIEGVYANASTYDLTFAAPDDGFALVNDDSGVTYHHYDGTDWKQCTEDTSERCGDIADLPDPNTNNRDFPSRLASAGRRIYIYGTEVGDAGFHEPVILHRDPGGQWKHDFNPGEAWQGDVTALAAVPRGEGYEGWALATRQAPQEQGQPAENVLLHLHSRRVEEWTTDDASADYLSPRAVTASPPILTVGTAGASFVLDPPGEGPLLALDEIAQLWRVFPAPYVDASGGTGRLGAGAQTLAMATDANGGFWAALRPTLAPEIVAFQHYTQAVPRPVFGPVAQPLQRGLTALAAAPDGQVWLAEDTGRLAHYERVTGWETVRIPGWDSKTTTNPVNALALGPDGRGIAVGDRGRIARIGPEGVQLDPAAGIACNLAELKPPCANGTLRAAAIAPDGSAIAAGEGMAINWRPLGGDFRAVGRPLKAGAGTDVTAISLPSPVRAYLATDSGQIFEGELGASGWRWRLANTNDKGDLITFAPDRVSTLALRAIAVGPDGHGYAVGDQGLLLERTGDAARPWRRLKTPHSVGLTAVALPVGGSAGALVGGEGGLVLTLQGSSFQVARPADPFSTVPGGVVGLAAVPGLQPGQTEAWAAAKYPSGALLHYSSDPDEPLLSPGQPRAHALPDALAPREGELAFAAFGKSDCQLPEGSSFTPCTELAGTNVFHEAVLQRIIGELEARSDTPGGPRFALYTGDVVDATGAAVAEPPDDESARPCVSLLVCSTVPAPHHRFIELVAEPLDQVGVPLVGAIGGADSDEQTGRSTVWRRAMERRPEPWGISDDELHAEDLSFEPAPGQEGDEFADPGDDADLTAPKMMPGGQGRTHYAVDVLRDDGDKQEAVARIVVLDTSQRSLLASDPQQQPLEPNGLQQGFLERMLCFEGQGDGCTREPGQQAIVLTNTPTYSYGPGAGDETATDGALLESILLRYRANVMVTGRLGWQGRYWATAPGLHEPCPGDPYQPDAAVPEAGGRICGRTADLPVEPEGTENLLEGAPQAPDPQAALGQLGGAGILPVVVSSTAGGKLAEPAGDAAGGFWHGYSIVRLDASGDPRKTIVEQRPIFDWVQVTAPDRTLLPRQRLALEGVGREPLAPDDQRDPGSDPWDQIDSYAITHRYDLLLANPEQPWLPCEASDSACQSLQARLAGDPRFLDSATGSADRSARNDTGECDPYLCLPERVGAIDSITGEVTAGDGKYPDTFAIAQLSVGEHVATYLLVFKKSPSYVVNPAVVLPQVSAVPSSSGSAPPPPPPPSPPKPNVPQAHLPELPALPGIPPLAAAQPPEPQPPAPPVPPPPAQQPSPLDLTVAPTALTVSTPAAVIQPPTPPVNPAPPSGARREARQRQAAAQRSGAGIDSDQPLEGVDPSEAQGRPDDIAVRNESMTRRAPDRAPSDKPLEATRRDRARPAPSFTPIARPEQPSAWATGALYSGGVALGALVLALGFSTLRPTPRAYPHSAPAHALGLRRSR